MLRRSARNSNSSSGLTKSLVSNIIDAVEPRPKRMKISNSSASGSSLKEASTAKNNKSLGISRYYEEQQWNKGFKAVAGVDEAGRGPLAGPVVAAACIIPKHLTFPGVDDSKKLSADERENLYESITSHPEVIWAAKAVEVATIDKINILQATMLAMEQAVSGLKVAADFVLVDGNRLPKGLDPNTAQAITKGDAKVLAIAAASIIAKVTRDRMMLELHDKYPQYNFNVHMGYGVPKHVEAIRKHGPCPAHRKSFNPVKSWFYAETEGEKTGEEKR